MATPRNRKPISLPKCASGIDGLDEVTAGGLPRGRPTLVCGAAGCGKTLLAVEFLVKGARHHGEPGVLMTFEERAEDVVQNVASLGHDLPALQRAGKLVVDHVRIDRSEIEETGEYDLEGLFIRLGYAIDSIKAKRVVLDTIESLFSGLSNQAILRAELRRLFTWLRDKGVTAIVTGEKGAGTLTRHGLEEYVSDCVILLDHRVIDQVSTRRLRIVKYRGSTHGTNEYPFLIDEGGISVIPITSMRLDHPATEQRVGSGVRDLDRMLGGGYFRGSSVLISGTAGTGKTSLAGHFAAAICRGGEKCLYLAFEESRRQIVRNMRSIGLDLSGPERRGLLRFVMARPTIYGLEMHLATMHRQVEQFKPAAVVLDPLSSLMQAGGTGEVWAMLTRLIDWLKTRQITAVMTALTTAGEAAESSEVKISSIVDTWLLLRDIESAGERNRVLYILKSRGMAHSNRIQELLLSDRGIQLLDVGLAEDGSLLTGSRRVAQAAQRAQRARAEAAGNSRGRRGRRTEGAER